VEGASVPGRDPAQLDAEIAAALRDSWDAIWQTRDRRREEHSDGSTLLLVEQALPAFRLELQVLGSDVELDAHTVSASFMASCLFEWAILLGVASRTETVFDYLSQSRSRGWVESAFCRTGMADWSAAHGAPLVGEDGQPLTAGQPTTPDVPQSDEEIMSFFQVQSLVEPTPAFPEGSVEFGQAMIRDALNEVAPWYREVLKQVANRDEIPRDEAAALYRMGLNALYSSVVGGAAIARPAGAGESPPDVEAMFPVGVLKWIGHSLLLVWGTDDPEERASLPLVPVDVLDEIGPTLGGSSTTDPRGTESAVDPEG
jgi:hypothetical protein